LVEERLHRLSQNMYYADRITQKYDNIVHNGKTINLSLLDYLCNIDNNGYM
jgi:hypothetical protein